MRRKIHVHMYMYMYTCQPTNYYTKFCIHARISHQLFEQSSCDCELWLVDVGNWNDEKLKQYFFIAVTVLYFSLTAYQWMLMIVLCILFYCCVSCISFHVSRDHDVSTLASRNDFCVLLCIICCLAAWDFKTWCFMVST